MKRTTLVTAIALLFTLGSGGLQAGGTCPSCRSSYGSDASWQGIAAFLATVLPIL
ncbi:MAG TPA: hypothetical protein VKB79_07075 [Bryobacteraceae bacterium]|nr:hypothetical protein [Bryobacteraceae bacterium]